MPDTSTPPLIALAPTRPLDRAKSIAPLLVAIKAVKVMVNYGKLVRSNINSAKTLKHFSPGILDHIRRVKYD